MQQHSHLHKHNCPAPNKFLAITSYDILATPYFLALAYGGKLSSSPPDISTQFIANQAYQKKLV